MTRQENDYQGWRFLYSRRWLGYYAMLLIFAIGCVLLSNWQFSRREEARAEIARIATNYDREPQPLTKIVTDHERFDEDAQKWLPVYATGHYTGEAVLVRNRPGASGTGSDLLQAFQITNGPVIFVDRGWIDYGAGDSAGDAAALDSELAKQPLAKTDTEVTVTVRLRASEPIVAGRESTKHTAGSIHVPELKKLAGLKDSTELITASYGMLISEDPEMPHGELPKKPEKDEGPHLSYALQWVVFIAIAGGGVGYAARQEFRNFNRGSAQVKRMDEKRAARKARRKASDAELEDAWLDAN